jgi:thiamine biosynthesis lipoprotein
VTDERRRIVVQIVGFAFVVALVLTFLARRRPPLERFDESGILMGTAVSVSVFDRDEERGKRAIEAAFAEIARVEALTTRYSEESEIERLNRRAAEVGETASASFAVDREVASVLARALEIAEMTDGAFDPTIAPLVDYWAVDKWPFEVPALDPRRIAEAAARVDYRLVVLDTAAASVMMPPTSKLDLDAIAKGYAVDRAVEVIAGRGIESAIVDAGGDVRLLGRDPWGGGWKVGVKHPREDGVIGVLTLDEGSVATSGDYQRSTMVCGMMIHGIFDPSTGFPAGGAVSVTVTAPEAIDADALATAVFVLGPEEGMEFVESLDGVETIIVTSRPLGDGTSRVTVGDVLVSSGLTDRFEEGAPDEQ